MVTRREFIKGIGKAFAYVYCINDFFNALLQLENFQFSFFDFFNPFYSHNSEIVKRAIEAKEIEITIYDINPTENEKINFKKLEEIIKALDDFELYVNYEPIFIDKEVVDDFSKKINVLTNKIKNLIHQNNFKEAKNVSKNFLMRLGHVLRI